MKLRSTKLCYTILVAQFICTSVIKMANTSAESVIMSKTITCKTEKLNHDDISQNLMLLLLKNFLEQGSSIET